MTDKMKVDILHVYGTEADIINAARVSHNSTGNAQSDLNLLRYLVKNKHFTPLRWANVDMRIEMPIFCARQFMRHTTGISYVEQSARYTELKDYYMPERLPEDKQCFISSVFETAFSRYETLLSHGVPKELARIILPMATMTKVAVTANLQSLLHLLTLRLDKHAQVEVREIAKMILEGIRPHYPNLIAIYEEIYWKGENYVY